MDKVHALTGEGATMRVLGEILTERAAQTAKFGVQNWPNGTSHWNATWRDNCRQLCETATKEKRLTWAHILQEEFTEVMAEEDDEPLIKELIQTAAVCVAQIECIRRRQAQSPV